MVLLSLLVACAWATTSLAVVSFPGSRSITSDANGDYVESSASATADARRRWVVDYGEMRPTVVYNCHYLIALCQNARAYLGNDDLAGFHFDRHRGRNDARRATICPTGWADTNCANGPQLDWYTSNDSGRTKYPPLKFCERDPKRYGYTKPGVKNEDGSDKIFAAGVISSCDEFPPASWIEGGVQGGVGAKAICAPWAQRYGRVNAWQTEQDWQGRLFGYVGTWLTRLTPGDRLSDENNDDMFSIYALSFKMVNEPNTPSALWLEANDKKRYCVGPRHESCPGTNGITDAEFDIVHDVNTAQLDLEAIVNPPGTPGSGTRRRDLNETIGYRSAAQIVPLAGMVMPVS